MNIHWEPTPKQEEALVRDEYEILYGGARGGGKTDAGMAWLLYDKDHPLYKALVIRRNADDLSDWVERAKRMYAPTGIEFTGKPAIGRWPSGAFIKLGHLKDDNAYEKYQGHEYHKILIEELTQIPSERRYEMLISSCRSTVDGISAQVMGTTNPGGPGHKWVKRRFIDPSISGKPFVNPKTGRSAIFISAKVDDNPYIVERDPSYITYLDNLPDDLRRAWREGSWELADVKGAYYGFEMREAWKQGRIGKIPHDKAALVHTAWDFGMNDTMTVIFFQVIGKEVRDIDYYESNHRGFDHYANILQAKKGELGYNYGYHFGPHDLRVQESNGKTRVETAAGLGIGFTVMNRVQHKMDGINMVRLLLPYCWFDSSRCEEVITGLENYRSEYNEELERYADKPLHDWSSHIADAKQTQAQGVNWMQKMQGSMDENRRHAAAIKHRVAGYGG